MVIISKLSGQLANRLHFVAHFMANSKAHRYRLIITCFPEFNELFEPQDQFFPAIVIRDSIFRKFINRFINNSKSVSLKLRFNIPGVVFHFIPQYDSSLNNFNIDSDDFTNLAKQKIVLPEGWIYRDFKHLKSFRKELAAYFSPKPIFKEQVQAEIDRAKLLGSTLIGIHIRRTDYKDFNSGKWYYSNLQYRAKMLEVTSILSNCVFILCADEKLDASDFEDLSVIYAPRPAIVDLYLLAACHYIMGPPSTFSGWASCIGDVPAYYINDPLLPIKINSFNKFVFQ